MRIGRRGRSKPAHPNRAGLLRPHRPIPSPPTPVGGPDSPVPAGPGPPRRPIGPASSVPIGPSGRWASATSVGATPHCGARLLRLRKHPMRFPPLAVIGCFPSVPTGPYGSHTQTLKHSKVGKTLMQQGLQRKKQKHSFTHSKTMHTQRRKGK